MRFAITPLGSVGGRGVDQVVDDIVRYLDRPRPSTGVGSGTVAPEGASNYYADSGDQAGRWLGGGAADLALRGDVAAADFASVLAGRDPRTGERLLGASGSAGRRPSLGRGSATVGVPSDEPLYGEADAAAALGIEADDLDRLLRHGVVQAIGALAGHSPGPGASYVVPHIDRDGTRWVSEAELSRAELARRVGPTPEDVARAGGSDDLLVLADAAQLVGVTTRYLRGLARRWETDRVRIEAAIAEGSIVERAYIPASRGPNGHWLIKRADLVAYVSRRRVPAVRVGFDLTLTTEKSLGVLALLGDADVRRATLGAIQAGNDTALAWWETRSAVARVGGERAPARGWTAASFRHLTSRALDPFPHHHNVVANTVEVDEGQRRTLDARSLYQHAIGASAIATAEMRYRLSVDLGVRWRPSDSGGWEIGGIPREVVREFSRRRTEIDEALAQLEGAIGRMTTIGELQQVITTTRPPKRQADAADLRADWWRRARALGFDPEALRRCVQPQTRRDVDVRALFDWLSSADGLCAASSLFTRDDVLAAIVDAPLPWPDGAQPPIVTSAELEALADRFLASPSVVRLQPSPTALARSFAAQPVFSTRDMLCVQARIVDRFRRISHAHAVVPASVLADAIENAGLGEDQQSLVAALCTSGRQFQCAIGRAGSGKTTAMRAAADAWRAAGYTVLGTAVKGEAARQLGQAAEIPTETLAWFLAHDDPQRPPFDARTVVIIDEASTIGDRDLDRLLAMATSSGATIRLLGDPAQHGAVAAGGMFRVLCELHPGRTPELHASRRLQHPGDRAAVDLLRTGKIEEALAVLLSAGHLHLAADDVQLYGRLLARWWAARQDGNSHPLVERSNHRRRQLNRLAHRLLQVNGDVDSKDELISGGRAFAVGDEVIARRGRRDLHPPGRPTDYVRNGARGVIVEVTRGTHEAEDSITVAFETGHVQLPRRFVDPHLGRRGVEVGIDHAYAVTSYAVQGATFGASTSRIDERSTRSETYVDITRGRHENHLFATRAADPLDGERLPRAPDPPLDVTIAIRQRASGPERTAWEVDPDALRRATRSRHAPSVT